MLFDFWLDKSSFWIGLAAGVIILILYQQVRPAIYTIRQIVRERINSIQEGMGTSIDQRYRQDIFGLMQDKHIASSLFSLNEIAIPPRLMAPPTPITPDGGIPSDDITQVAIPYLPDWAFVGATFGVKTLSIPEAMSKGANLLIIGNPGSGKTFALSYLASKIAIRHPDAENLGRLVPVMLHVGELSLTSQKENPIGVFYDALWKQVSSRVESQLKNYLKTALESSRAIIMIDGLDELPSKEQTPIINFIRSIQGKYPGNRYIITSSTEDISSYDSLELHPIPIAAWTTSQKQEFVGRWSELWKKFVINQPWAKRLPKSVDTMLLNNWLINFTNSHSPLLLTLKAWAIYAGDITGPYEVDAMESYVQRMTVGVVNARPALEQLAAQMTLTLKPIIERKIAGDFVSVFEEDGFISTNETQHSSTKQEHAINSRPEELLESKVDSADASSPLYDQELEDLLTELDDLDLSAEENDEEIEEVVEEKNKKESAKAGKQKDTIRKRQVRRILPELVTTEVLTFRPDSKISFSHPVINSYLAACSMANRGGGQQLVSQSSWAGKFLAFNFLSAKGDVDPMIDHLLSEDRTDPLKRGLLSMGHWPRQAPKTALWRKKVLRMMANTLQDTNLPLGLRTRVLTSLAMSGENGIDSLFRKMLKSEDHSARWLGALGCGLIGDLKSVDGLGLLLLYDSSIFISRAACISLIVIDTNKSIEHVARALLEASEEARRAAAEGLAHHPIEGHAILKDGAIHKDILVRRAIVFGLGIANEQWAIEILEQMQVQDDEWVVRNAATQALENIKNTDPSIPTPLPEIHETPWLLQFASERGMGVSLGQGGWDMLATALKEGNEDQRMAAMEIYRLTPSEGKNVISTLLDIMNGPEGDIREAAYNTIWHLSAAGVEIPVVF